MRTRNIILLILLLVIADQVVKLIIYKSFMEVSGVIVPQVLEFKPIFNNKYSFVNDLTYKKTGMDAGLIFHAIVFALVWLVLFPFYKFFKNIAPGNKTLDVSFSFLTAGVICAYLGILIWQDGTLDFLHFKLGASVVFDLKDIYINCFVILLIISTKKIEKEHKTTLQDMMHYIKSLFFK